MEEARHRVPEHHMPLVVRLVEMIDTNEHASRSWLPVAPGFSWTYGVRGSKPRTRWTAGEQDRFEFAYAADGEPSHLVGYDLRGTDLGVARLTSRDDLGGLFVRREIGYGGAPAWVPDLWLPLEGPEEFTFNTSQGGCSYWKVHGRRSGPEVIEVPAGRFEALRFDLKGLGVTTVWLARGVGIVRVAGWPMSSSDGQVLELHEHVTRLKP
jgi:hypothetical protein